MNLESGFLKPRDNEKQETRLVTFKDNEGNVAEIECEIVDLTAKEYDEKFKNAELFMKTAEVKARQVTEEEKIVTDLDATENIAKPGDWIVTNPGGEQYVVSNEVFNKKYEPKEDEEGVFVAKGAPVKVIPVEKDIVFKAPWGSDQAVRAGGFLIEQANGERYGIDREAFLTTYKKVEKKQEIKTQD